MAPDPHAPEADRMDAALALFRRLHHESPAASPHRLALQAVDAVYCTLLDVTSDSAVCRLSPSREEHLAATVLSRAGVAAWGSSSPSLPDAVERASEQSFPSSDPPGWIWGPPDPPKAG